MADLIANFSRDGSVLSIMLGSQVVAKGNVHGDENLTSEIIPLGHNPHDLNQKERYNVFSGAVHVGIIDSLCFYGDNAPISII